MVQWLGLPLTGQGVQILPLVRELRHHLLCSKKQNKTKKPKTWNRNNIVTNSVESVQVSSAAQSSLTLWHPKGCSPPDFPVHHQLLRTTQTHVHRVGDAIQRSLPLSPSSPTFSLSQHQGLFQWVSSSHRWLKYWSFKFSIGPSNEYWGLISFRIDWVYFLAVQGSLKSLIQHYSSKASILQHSAFFIVQLSHPYMTTGKTIVWLDGPLLAK